MLVADSFVGNVNDDAELADRLERADALTVTVSETERRRSRFRTTANNGADLGVVVGRELRSGDVLSADGSLVRVSLEPVDALVVDLGGVDADLSAVTAALAFGHAVGNRHWDLAVDGDRAYLPVADSRERMEAEIEPHLPNGATVGYDETSPTLFGETDVGHAHSDGHDRAHSHPHGSDGHGDGVRELDTERSS